MSTLPAATKRARLFRLQAVVAFCDRVDACIRSRRGSRSIKFPSSIGRGVSVIIPERGSPQLLRACLESLERAAREVEEPLETIVVVNGSEPGDYQGEVRRFGDVQWVFVPDSLSFNEAVRRGMSAARHPWTYLLNSDVVLEQRALAELLPWRAPHVFSIASQILPQDLSRRREETGWTVLRCPRGSAETLDALPEDEVSVRGGVYAGGGSSLFQSRLLRRMVGWSDAYSPFYWEDAEWGVLAWKQGYETLFCPLSRAWHTRRGTISRYYDPGEIERIFRRNGLLFHLRNLDRMGSMESVYLAAAELDDLSFLELTSKRNAAGILRTRLFAALQPFDDSCLGFAHLSYFLRPASSLHTRPLVLMVSPFAMYPPAHGGAIRMHRLVEALSDRYNVILLADEAEAFTGGPGKHFGNLAAVHLVGGRATVPAGAGRSVRGEMHCHPQLRQELWRLIGTVRPDIVQIEFSELAGLVAMRRGERPWSISLHDVNLGVDGSRADDAREMEQLSRFDRVFVCSDDDAALIPGLRPAVVPNGMDEMEYVPSEDSGRGILFAGPFRYRPNFEGISEFVRDVFPQLRRCVPGAELWILAGAGASERTNGELDWFRIPGLTMYDYNADPRPFLRRCVLTINPVSGIRGSSVKLLESVAAGRVCVSTRDGARGFLSDCPPSLIVVERTSDFLEPLQRLLLDSAFRRSIEQPPAEYLARHSWKASAGRFVEEYVRLLGEAGLRQPRKGL
jgi:GT2 family glycosyltransferase